MPNPLCTVIINSANLKGVERRIEKSLRAGERVYSQSGFDLDSATYELCDLGEVTSFSESQFSQRIIMSTQCPKKKKRETFNIC